MYVVAQLTGVGLGALKKLMITPKNGQEKRLQHKKKFKPLRCRQG